MPSKWSRCLVALFALAHGCAPPPVTREGWQPEAGPAALLAASIAPLSALEDLTAEAAIELRQGSQRERGTALIQLINPDLFRVEVRGPFFTHIFTALLEGDSLTVYGRAVDPPLKGAARGHLLKALIGLDLGQYDLRYALLGLVEPGPFDGPVEYPRADRVVVGLAGGRHAWLDMHRGLVMRESIELFGGGTLTRELKEYRLAQGLYLPRRVEIRQAEVSLSLDYRSYSLNDGLDPEQLQRGVPQAAVRRVP